MDQANISVRTGTYSTRILGTTIRNVPNDGHESSEQEEGEE